MATLHSALFIDYDNVRTELDRYDPAIAARFSNKTLLWLDALEEHLGLSDGIEEEKRHIVSRRCYASPHLIGPYRRNFTQTGFEVIDCPPLTTHLKNSADIYIVMDVIDYLARYPHIDEYIILSGDADFVPVLNRLRKELKRSVIFASYNTTAAYRNCSDQRIEAEFFAEHLAAATTAPRAAQAAASAEAAPGSAPRLGEKPGAAIDPGLSAAIEDCLVRAAARRMGRLPFASAAHALRDQLAAELGGGWAGHRTFTALLEHVTLRTLEVDWKAQEINDPEFEVDLAEWDEADRERLSEFVTDLLGNASKPVPPLPPAEYSLIFDQLAAYYLQPEPGTFAHCIGSVVDVCRERGVDVSPQEIRFIATGISMQQYRFTEARDARHLASLWRAQVFDLCREPDWMREAEDAELLASWFHAADETVEQARDDFLARTAGEEGEIAAEGAEATA
ncbi:MAG: hypothetical protein QOG13_969 [Sphingomonadales bacterium]|jgi:uncharacterized LabA/DUF88 family protein|nr:hypothetical protein [Sphingomonadales bacterium]